MEQLSPDTKRSRKLSWKLQSDQDDAAAVEDAAATDDDALGSGECAAKDAGQLQKSAAGAAAAACHPNADSNDGTVPGPASQLPLTSLPSDLLPQVLAHVSGDELLRLSQVSADFARACEECFKAVCEQHKWRFPRIPRGVTAGHKCFPWRALYRQHACRSCGAVGDFPCRRGLGMMRGNSCLFLICKRCIQLASARQRLAAEGLHVDLIGLSGQKLLPAKKKGNARQRRRS